MLFERYKRDGRFENDRLFGVLNYFSTQASSFAAQRLGIDPNSVNVPIVGGGCPKTAVPLFSLTTPAATFSPEELYRLRNAMKRADEKVAAEKCGEGASSSTTTEPYSWPMCAGFAAAKFCVSLCKAMKDEAGVVECAFVRSCLIPGLNYCGAPLRLGPNGIQRHLGLPKVSADECRQLEEAIPLIRRDIKVGERWDTEKFRARSALNSRVAALFSITKATTRRNEALLRSQSRALATTRETQESFK
uniref:Lactate/malate dehydrogenase C-terminal domain-containing protein n=1 Tax=Trichogramma kaykai TaxID=54128 RepID=A0ABD2XD98_9HYME